MVGRIYLGIFTTLLQCLLFGGLCLLEAIVYRDSNFLNVHGHLLSKADGLELAGRYEI